MAVAASVGRRASGQPERTTVDRDRASVRRHRAAAGLLLRAASMMQVLRAAAHRVMPWKNGGGSTTEVAVAPDGAGLDEFDWRISMAVVGADGPFSGFPGVDRTLAVPARAGLPRPGLDPT